MAGVDCLLTVTLVARVLHCTRLENELSKVGFVGFPAHMFDKPTQENELQARFEILRWTMPFAYVRVRVAVLRSRLGFQRFILENIDQLIVCQIVLTDFLEDLHFGVVLNAGCVREKMFDRYLIAMRIVGIVAREFRIEIDLFSFVEAKNDHGCQGFRYATDTIDRLTGVLLVRCEHGVTVTFDEDYLTITSEKHGAAEGFLLHQRLEIVVGLLHD